MHIQFEPQHPPTRNSSVIVSVFHIKARNPLWGMQVEVTLRAL